MIYRIITEDKDNEKQIASIVLRRFEGFSISKQVGYYKGIKENSLVIEIAKNYKTAYDVSIAQTAREIAKETDQECVLVEKIEAKVSLITGG